jgi:hypothetical protein
MPALSMKACYLRTHAAHDKLHVEENKKIVKKMKYVEDVKYMDADEGLVLAGASLGISMLIVWIVFIIALLWIRGIG